jgi:hypothetical protein
MAKTGGGAEIPPELTVGRQVWWQDAIKGVWATGNIVSIGEGIVVARAVQGFERVVPWTALRLRPEAQEPGTTEEEAP